MVLIYRREITVTYHGGFMSYKIPIIEVYGKEKPCILIALNLSRVYGKPTIIEDLWYVIRKLRGEEIAGKVTFAYITRKFKQRTLDNVLNFSNYNAIVEVLLLGKSYPYLIGSAYSEKRDFGISELWISRESEEFLKKISILASKDNITHMVYVASSSIKVNGKNSSELNYNALMNILKAYNLIPGSLDNLKLIDERFREVKILTSRSKGGILLLKNSVGQKIIKDALIYEIKDVFGELVDSMVFSGKEGVIISCTEKMFVKPYDYVVSIATV